MTRFLSVLSAVSVVAFASCAAPRAALHYSPPSVAPVRENVSDAQSHVTNAQTHAQKAKAAIADAIKQMEMACPQAAGLKLDLADANREIDALTYELNVAQESLKSANVHVDQLEGKIGEQTNLLNTANDEKNAAITKADAAAHRYHKLKFYVCALGAALALLLIFKFKGLLTLLGPYGAIAYAAGPAAVFGALWLFL
jgi:uncharacterized lipoprotein YajG